VFTICPTGSGDTRVSRRNFRRLDVPIHHNERPQTTYGLQSQNEGLRTAFETENRRRSEFFIPHKVGQLKACRADLLDIIEEMPQKRARSEDDRSDVVEALWPGNDVCCEKYC
jgi:hypothetical protein